MPRPDEPAAPDDPKPAIASYRIARKLGEGGMGVVYEATDERLQRRVALKLIRDETADSDQRKRFWREARMAARINHPGICQVYEIGEDAGSLFIAMELLEGDSLARRIADGPVPLGESVDIVLEVLDALGTLHENGVVHRDLKPTNIHLTKHGVKLLDFGLARPQPIDPTDATSDQVTRTGMIVGTPTYMAPEQWSDAPPGPRCDLFALGAILYEMLTGRRAFGGSTILEVCRAVLNEDPPPLTGGPEVLAVDRVIQRALAKEPRDRFPDARAMGEALLDSRQLGHDEPNAPVGTTKRLVVLPFRLLVPDEQIGFLSISLPDAIMASLSGVPSLVVLSSSVVSRPALETLDVKAVAEETGADVVLTGTLLRAAERVRVASQLIDSRSGAILDSRTFESPLGDIFQLQDDLARDVVQSLSVPLGGAESGPLQRDVPRDAKVYERYLRANELGRDLRLLSDAKNLYLSCVDEDPDYAPAWARLGRVYRVMAKYGEGDPGENVRLASQAFNRALALNPDLSLAHDLYTGFELEQGRAEQSMLRLLDRIRTNPTAPELFSGLVTACRFCGLLEASLAADRSARRLAPAVRTSVAFTHWMIGDYEKAIVADDNPIPFVTYYSLPRLGREAEVERDLSQTLADQPPGLLADALGGHLAAIRRDRKEILEIASRLEGSSFRDPEGFYFLARGLAWAGATEKAIDWLERVVESGFTCPTTMAHDPWLDALRDDPAYERLLSLAERRHLAAATAFTRAGGERILGASPSA